MDRQTDHEASPPPEGNRLRAGGPEGLPSHFLTASWRGQLVRLCRRLTGAPEAAEDLAQEALLVAWRRAAQGRAPREWRPYLIGITRRLSLNWQSRRAGHTGTVLPPLAEGGGAESTDPLALLLRAERAQIIDRALAQLGGADRSLLIAYYVEEAPVREIADAMRLTENTAAVRLHRARTALGRLLAGDMRSDAVAHGLIGAESAAGWSQTRLWCPRCGRTRLQGRFPALGDGLPDFALRCPSCDRASPPPLGFTGEAAPLSGAGVLRSVRGYRAAFTRLHRWWERGTSWPPSPTGWPRASIVGGLSRSTPAGRTRPRRPVYPPGATRAADPSTSRWAGFCSTTPPCGISGVRTRPSSTCPSDECPGGGPRRRWSASGIPKAVPAWR